MFKVHKFPLLLLRVAIHPKTPRWARRAVMWAGLRMITSRYARSPNGARR